MKPYTHGALLRGVVVAPRTGAWIETAAITGNFHGGDVAPRTGAWIETGLYVGRKIWECSRPPHGGVD